MNSISRESFSLEGLVYDSSNQTSSAKLDDNLEDSDIQHDIDFANKILQNRKPAESRTADVSHTADISQYSAMNAGVENQNHSQVGAESDPKPSKFKPIAGVNLTIEQARLFGLDQLDDVKQQQSFEPSPRLSKERVERLSMAKKHPVSDGFLLDDDIENCTFRPSRSRKAKSAMMNPSCGYDFVKTAQTSFLERTATAERVRRLAIDRRRAEKDYKCLVGKKKCPVCESEQSYDEVVEKRKKCPKCNENYVNPLVILKKKWKKTEEDRNLTSDSAMSSPRPTSRLTMENRQEMSRLVVMT